AAGCLTAETTQAIDQATADGVDVINFSIGGGSNNPWTDSNAQAFLGARDAGVFVSVAAGNSGPAERTMGSPANAPWVTAVAAAGGAGGYSLAKDQASGNSLIADAFAIPGIALTYSDGLAVKAWLASPGTHTATIAGATVDLSASNGDQMASFSSRGPDKTVP